MKKIMFALLAATSLAACSQIDTGNMGVEATFGQIKEQPLVPGVYFTLFKTVWEINTKEFGLELNDLQPKAHDNVTMTDVDVTVYYKPNPMQVPKIMTKYAGDVSRLNNGDYVVGANLINRMAREAVYNAFAKFNASEMHLKRTDIANSVRESLQKEIDSDAGNGMFEITNVMVRNVVTDPRLEEAIKQSAEVEFAIRKKQQELELARSEAARKKVEAEGEATANKIISDSLSPALIELRRIESMNTFAKTGTHTVILPQNTQPLVQVK